MFDLVKYYRRALGPQVQEATDLETDAVTLTAGTSDNFRLVVLTPKSGSIEAALERVQYFPVSPRVYTVSEQKAVDLLKGVADKYASAFLFNTTITQTVELPNNTEETPPTLLWSFDLNRHKSSPLLLLVSAKVDGETVLSMSNFGQVEQQGPAENGSKTQASQSTDKANVVTLGVPKKILFVTNSEGVTEQRSIEAGLTPEALAEIYGDPAQDPVGDPAIRMLLGTTLVTPNADYIGLQALPGVNPAKQINIVLTYPEFGMKAWLTIDRATNYVTRSVVERTQEGQVTRTIRTYTIRTMVW